jgi:3-(3-hydroxy-phenyl)propionate hydroxylase
LGAQFIAARPLTQLHWAGHDDPDVVIVGDRSGGLKAWFDAHQESVVFLRPDRCIAGACIAQLSPEVSDALMDALTLTPGGGDVDSANGSLLYVPQPASESTGAAAGSA